MPELLLYRERFLLGKLVEGGDLCMTQIYVNWIDGVVLVNGRALPFWWHGDDEKVREFHRALSGGFCPLCGKDIEQAGLEVNEP